MFRGREIKKGKDDSVSVQMKTYALGLQRITVPHARRRVPASPLVDSEIASLRKATGELSWLSRQLRADLAFQTGHAQRAMSAPCAGDLLFLPTAPSGREAPK